MIVLHIILISFYFIVKIFKMITISDDVRYHYDSYSITTSHHFKSRRLQIQIYYTVFSTFYKRSNSWFIFKDIVIQKGIEF